MDCATTKKRVKQCDAECPAGQSQSSTVEGHEVRRRHAGHAGLPCLAFIANLGPYVVVVSGSVCHCCWGGTLEVQVQHPSSS